MVWSIEEYQGMLFINQALVEHLNQYLDEKERHLGIIIIEAIHTGTLPPTLPSSLHASIRFHEAVEAFGKRIHQLKYTRRESILTDDWKHCSEQVNAALWEYLEILEGCVTELFQQLDQINFEQWNADLTHAVTLIKDALMHRLEDVLWGVKRLDHHLKDYRELCEGKQTNWTFWKNPSLLMQKPLDSSLSSHLIKTQKLLEHGYQKFMLKFKNYLQLYDKAEEDYKKFYDYKIFVTLDLDTQDKLRKTDVLLNLWELNSSAKILPEFEPVWALRNIMSPYAVHGLFQEYFEALRSAIFEKSRLLKKKFQFLFHDKEGRTLLANTISRYQEELDKLKSIVAKYNNFLENTDRSFSESREGKKLKTLKDKIVSLNVICSRFRETLEKDPSLVKSFTIQKDQAIQKHLHEMGQPLATKRTMISEGKTFLKHLNDLDELGSPNIYVVEYVGNSLSKAMKADWRYNVLQELPLFHQLYEIHQYVAEPLDDRQHSNRMNMFKRSIEHFENWIKNGETLQHTHAIDLEMNDMKESLQDFLAKVQRIEKQDESNREEMFKNIAKANQELLEYRYLFAKFFHSISGTKPEEILLRKQLLFVDQYFSSVETRLQDMRKPHEPLEQE